MKRIFWNYELWEDHKRGLYDITRKYSEIEEMDKTAQAKSLLTNSEWFLETAMKVITEWKYSSDVNLSNKSRNRQAWIGQASCCYVFGTPEYITKYGWRLMTPTQQIEANRIADIIIKTWEMNQKCPKNTSLKMFLNPVKTE